MKYGMIGMIYGMMTYEKFILVRYHRNSYYIGIDHRLVYIHIWQLQTFEKEGERRMNKTYQKEYLGEWQEPALELLLWLKYDYETEIYDLTLSYVMKNGVAYPVGKDSMALSQSNAIDWLSWMYATIKEYDISVEEFHKAKTSRNRGNTSKEILKIYHEHKKYMPWEKK